MTTSCTDPGCGAPKGRGRPRAGQLKLEADFTGNGRDDRWYCGWACLAVVVAEQLERNHLVPTEPSESLF